MFLLTQGAHKNTQGGALIIAPTFGVFVGAM